MPWNSRRCLCSFPDFSWGRNCRWKEERTWSKLWHGKEGWVGWDIRERVRELVSEGGKTALDCPVRPSHQPSLSWRTETEVAYKKRHTPLGHKRAPLALNPAWNCMVSLSLCLIKIWHFTTEVENFKKKKKSLRGQIPGRHSLGFCWFGSTLRMPVWIFSAGSEVGSTDEAVYLHLCYRTWPPNLLEQVFLGVKHTSKAHASNTCVSAHKSHTCSI